MKKLTKEERATRRRYRRHVRWWKFLHLFGPIIKGMYKLHYDKVPEINGSYLVLANHTTNLDPAIVGLNFKKHMYFVASEHVYRQGWKSKILWWIFEPIAKMKGSSDTLTVMKTIRTLREGKNVCIFAEGNRTWNGKSDPSLLTSALGKLVKASAANLVTYKIEGGFFADPRWGYSRRKGWVHEGVVNVYKKEQLKDMSAEEIVDVIRKDIYQNDYETQAKNPVRYKGKNLAEGLETALCVCPECKSIGKLTTLKNSIKCTKCDLSTEYTEYGYFSDGFKFHTIEEWDDWQEAFYKDYISQIPDTTSPLFADEDVELNALSQDHSSQSLGKGTFTMFKDRFEFTTNEKTTVIPFNEIPDMSIFAKTGLTFKNDKSGIHYEFKTDRRLNVRKYLSCWNYLRTPAPEGSV